MKEQLFSIIQVVLGVILIGLILLQTKGSGLGATFGGEISFYQTRRGLEKLLFYLTIIISAIFLISSLIGILM